VTFLVRAPHQPVPRQQAGAGNPLPWAGKYRRKNNSATCSRVFEPAFSPGFPGTFPLSLISAFLRLGFL